MNIKYRYFLLSEITMLGANNSNTLSIHQAICQATCTKPMVKRGVY